jgi:hypothetical protein
MASSCARSARCSSCLSCWLLRAPTMRGRSRSTSVARLSSDWRLVGWEAGTRGVERASARATPRCRGQAGSLDGLFRTQLLCRCPTGDEGGSGEAAGWEPVAFGDPPLGGDEPGRRHCCCPSTGDEADAESGAVLSGRQAESLRGLRGSSAASIRRADASDAPLSRRRCRSSLPLEKLCSAGCAVAGLLLLMLQPPPSTGCRGCARKPPPAVAGRLVLEVPGRPRLLELVAGLQQPLEVAGRQLPEVVGLQVLAVAGRQLLPEVVGPQLLEVPGRRQLPEVAGWRLLTESSAAGLCGCCWWNQDGGGALPIRGAPKGLLSGGEDLGLSKQNPPPSCCCRPARGGLRRRGGSTRGMPLIGREAAIAALVGLGFGSGGGSAPHSAMSTSESRLAMPMLGSGASGVGRSRGTSTIARHEANVFGA